MLRRERVFRFREFFRAYEQIAGAKPARPERFGNEEVIQKAYEDLFKFCRKNELALPALLQQAEVTLIDQCTREYLTIRVARRIAADEKSTDGCARVQAAF